MSFHSMFFPQKKISHPYYLFTQSFVAWLFLFCCSVNAFAQTAQISNPIGSNQSTIPQFSAVASSLVAGVTYNVAISESPRGGVGNQYIDWWVKQGVTVNDLLPTNANRLTWSSGWTRNIRSGGYDGAVTSSTLGSPASLTPGKTYYWHIVGTNGTKSAQASFTVMSLPAQPALTISHNLNRNLFEISWNSVSNVSRYELYRSNSLIYSGMATSQSVPIISAGVSYPFLLKACNAAGCTNGSSSTGNFPVPPATAIIQSPAVGGTASTIPLFAATTASLVSTASYTLAISESPRAGLNGQYVDYWSLGGLSSSALIAGNAGQTSWNTNWVQRTRNGNPDGAATIVSNTSPPALTVGKTYYWHIVASGSNGGLSKSAEGRFVVGAAASSSALSMNLSGTASSFIQSIVQATPVDPAADTMAEGVYKGALSGIQGVGADGSFNYSVPISIPVGINGVQPKLQLSYSSNQKNGLLGWGWALNGLSVISRCNATMVRDGYTSGIQSGDNYKYCLDGQRLVEVGNGEYRTESESFLRIKKLGDYWAVTNNAGMESRYGYNANSKMEDDQSQPYVWYLDKQQDVSGNNWTVSYTKTTVGDLYSHYPASISYTNTTLTSGLQSVIFHYEDRADISVKYVAGVRVKTDKRLARVELKSANATVHSYVLAYQQAGQTYHGKAYSDPAKTSRLASIANCYGSSTTDCSAPVAFDWNLQTVANYKLAYVERPVSAAADTTLWLDINGDGVLESNTTMLPVESVTKTYANGTTYEVGATQTKIDINQDGRDDIVWNGPISGLKIFLSNGTTINETSAPEFDIARSELVFNSATRFHYIGPMPSPWTVAEQEHYYQRSFVDVNSDGYVDLVRAPYCIKVATDIWCDYESSPGDISVALNNKGLGFLPFETWINNWKGNGQENHDISFPDLNGDGSKDLFSVGFHSSPIATDFPTYMGISNGTGNSTSISLLGRYFSELLLAMRGDFNGDGVMDGISVPKPVNGSMPTGEAGAYPVAWGVGKPINAGTTIPGLRTTFATPVGHKYLRFCGRDALPRTINALTYDRCSRSVVDFNSDGLDDIVESGARYSRRCLEPVGAAIDGSCTNVETRLTDHEARVYLSLGADAQGNPSFSPPVVYRDWNTVLSLHPNISEISGFDFNASLKFSDFDNDGAYEDHYRLRNNVVPNRIDAVVEANRRIDIEYATLASNTIYEVIPTDTEIEVELGYIKQTKTLAKRLAVKKIEITNGAGGTNKIEYKYKGAKTHGAGYGELGFAEVEKLETIEGSIPLKTITKYYQTANSQYKLAGKIKSEVVYKSNASGANTTLLSTTNYQWKVRIYSDDIDTAYKSPHYFAYLLLSSTEQKDLDGSTIKTGRTYNSSVSTALSCSNIGANPVIKVTEAGSSFDKEYSADGVIAESYTVSCDESGSQASIQVNGIENLDITGKGNARGLVQKRKQYAWVGNDISSTVKTAFDVRTQSFTYNDVGQLESRTIEPDATAVSALKLTTTYGYNSYGSVNSMTETWLDTVNDGLDVVTRTTSITESYDSAGVRTLEVTSPLNLKETTKFHPVWGLPTSEVDANGLETKRFYDGLGRPNSIKYADNTETKIDYRLCSGCSTYHNNAVWYQQTKTTGSSAVRTYYDGFNRDIGSRSKGLGGQDVYTTQSYNSRGNAYQVTAPFFYGGSQQTTTYTYDALGRISNIAYPDSTNETHTYAGLQHTTTNRLGQTQTRYLNAAGWVMRSQDNTNTPVDFTYWPWGDLNTSQVNNDVKTRVSVVYDKLGRKTEMTDPNTGKTLYTYNALGLIATQTDAKNQRTCFGYDVLGRQVKRVDKASSSCTGTSTQHWAYDTKPNGKGQLASVNGVGTDGSSYSESYSYTSKGLPQTTAYSLVGSSYSITQHYDSFSRPLGVTYPTGYVVANRYNSYGHLHEVIDSAGTRIWKADDADALGNLKQFTLGNGTVTNQTYDVNNNRIASIRAVKGSLVIQDQYYQFDALGNLSSREDRKNAITQSFCYDGLNRLKAARFTGCSSANNDYVYDPLGNLTTKLTDAQALTMGYGTNGSNVAGPHAVTSANGWTYKYDVIGNLESATKSGEATRTVQYSPFNTPTSITQGSKFSTIVYGPNQERIQHSDSNGRVTKYVGGIYEEVTRNGETQKIHYVGDMALFISKGANTNATYHYEYLHRDHIGSIVALSKGTVNSALDVQWQANGTRGERRYQQWNGPLDNALIPTSTARGFTDHEHLDSVGLIHMNGRVYDPELGRFMSADPFVQSPYNTQSYNRYSYVFNNPLSFTDPSGYTKSCGYTECDDDTEETPPTIGNREVYEQQRRQDAFTQWNKDSWYSWSNYQSMVTNATAGLLYSQAIVNGGSTVWNGYKISVPVASAGGGSIVVGGGNSGGSVVDGLGKLLSTAVRGAGGILISSLALTGSSERKNGVALYRAASLTEINDIMKCSCFRPGPNSYEGKLFARNMADAQTELRHVKALDKKLGMPTEYGIVITRVSEGYFRTLEQIPNVDRLISPVVNVHFDQLPAFNAEARRHGIYWQDE